MAEISQIELEEAARCAIKARIEGASGGAGRVAEVNRHDIESLLGQWSTLVNGMSERELARLEKVHQFHGLSQAFDRLTDGYKLVGAPVGDNYAETAIAIKDRVMSDPSNHVSEYTEQPLLAKVGEYTGEIYGSIPKDRGDGMVMIGLACYAKFQD